MTAHAGRNLLLLLCIPLSACTAADRTTVYLSADVATAPSSRADLLKVTNDEQLSRLSAPIVGENTIVQFDSTSMSIPLVNDNASRLLVTVVFSSAPAVGKHKIGDGTITAHLTAGPPSRPIGAYCLGVADAGYASIMPSKEEGLFDVEVDISFIEISPAGFKDVCVGRRFTQRVTGLRPADLKRLSQPRA